MRWQQATEGKGQAGKGQVGGENLYFLNLSWEVSRWPRQQGWDMLLGGVSMFYFFKKAGGGCESVLKSLI